MLDRLDHLVYRQLESSLKIGRKRADKRVYQAIRGRKGARKIIRATEILLTGPIIWRPRKGGGEWPTPIGAKVSAENWWSRWGVFFSVRSSFKRYQRAGRGDKDECTSQISFNCKYDKWPKQLDLHLQKSVACFDYDSHHILHRLHVLPMPDYLQAAARVLLLKSTRRTRRSR